MAAHNNFFFIEAQQSRHFIFQRSVTVVETDSLVGLDFLFVGATELLLSLSFRFENLPWFLTLFSVAAVVLEALALIIGPQLGNGFICEWIVEWMLLKNRQLARHGLNRKRDCFSRAITLLKTILLRYIFSLHNMELRSQTAQELRKF